MDTQYQRLSRLIADYTRLTEYDGAEWSEAEMADLRNNINGLAISIVDTLLFSPLYREIKDRAAHEKATACDSEYCLVHGTKQP